MAGESWWSSQNEGDEFKEQNINCEAMFEWDGNNDDFQG